MAVFDDKPDIDGEDSTVSNCDFTEVEFPDESAPKLCIGILELENSAGQFHLIKEKVVGGRL